MIRKGTDDQSNSEMETICTLHHMLEYHMVS